MKSQELPQRIVIASGNFEEHNKQANIEKKEREKDILNSIEVFVREGQQLTKEQQIYIVKKLIFQNNKWAKIAKILLTWEQVEELLK